MSGPKSFQISKHMVYEAYLRVKASKGAAGVDGQSVEQFGQDLKGNLYKLWNRMSSGCYFPPPVRMVEIPKPGGKGVRVLGVPSVADRIAQTVAAMALEPEVEKIFHPDSYGYRPRKSALDAVGACRERCWAYGWVVDLDIKGLPPGAVSPLVADLGPAMLVQRFLGDSAPIPDEFLVAIVDDLIMPLLGHPPARHPPGRSPSGRR